MNPTSLVLVKHALPVLDATKPAKEWQLGAEGERQSRRLAGRLRTFAPLHLVASPEPKASRTAELVGAELGVRASSIDGLREFDRPRLPFLSKPDHERANAQIFVDLSRRVLGAESGREALDRFSAAIDAAIGQTRRAKPRRNHARHRDLAVRGGSQRHRRVRDVEAASSARRSWCWTCRRFRFAMW